MAQNARTEQHASFGMELRRYREAAVLLVLVAMGGCAATSQNKPPALTNMYTTKLSAYWQEMTRFAAIDPDDGRIQEWSVNYDEDGTVVEHRIIFVAERKTHSPIWYTLIQSRNGETSFDEHILDGPPPKETVSAVHLFAELDEVGMEQLEAHSGATHPVFMRLHITYGSITYGPNTYVIEDGRIASPGPAGITLTGGQGALLLSGENYRGPLNTYVIPTAVHHEG